MNSAPTYPLLFAGLTVLGLGASACSEKTAPPQADVGGVCTSAFIDSYNNVRDKARGVTATVREGTREEARESLREMQSACRAFFTAFPDVVCRASRAGVPATAKSAEMKAACAKADEALPLYERAADPAPTPGPGSKPARPPSGSDSQTFAALAPGRVVFRVSSGSLFKKLVREKLVVIDGQPGTPAEFQTRLGRSEVFCLITKTGDGDRSFVASGSVLRAVAKSEQQRDSIRVLSFATDRPYALACARQNSSKAFTLGEARKAFAGVLDIDVQD